jgi:hypothetical protein
VVKSDEAARLGARDAQVETTAPKSVNDKLSNPEFKRAIAEGMRQLNGEDSK